MCSSMTLNFAEQRNALPGPKNEGVHGFFSVWQQHVFACSVGAHECRLKALSALETGGDEWTA